MVACEKPLKSCSLIEVTMSTALAYLTLGYPKFDISSHSEPSKAEVKHLATQLISALV